MDPGSAAAGSQIKDLVCIGMAQGFFKQGQQVFVPGAKGGGKL